MYTVLQVHCTCLFSSHTPPLASQEWRHPRQPLVQAVGGSTAPTPGHSDVAKWLSLLHLKFVLMCLRIARPGKWVAI